MNKFLAKITFYQRPWLWKAFLAAALLASFGLRMINLQDPPLDFASTRQLFSALKARGIYYEYLTNVPEATRNQAISLGDVGIVEPPLLESPVEGFGLGRQGQEPQEQPLIAGPAALLE